MSSVDFLQLAGKTVLVFGAANRKSVAFHVGEVLTQAGAQVVYSVHTEARKQQLAKLLPQAEIHVCDVAADDQLAALREAIAARHESIHGVVHSIAFGDYSDGLQPFHETSRRAFLQAVDVSCYSLIAISRQLSNLMARDGAIVAISISTTKMASESYGFMAPIKAALDSTVVFLAKSLSKTSEIRCNAVSPGLLKTASSAGIPGYVDAYLYAEQATLRRKALATGEVANVVAFLLSPRSSGINAQHLVVDAGMSVNYFDNDLIRRASRPD